MLATQEQGHFSCWRKVTNGSAEGQTVAFKFGLIVPSVTDQIQLVMSDPNEHPMVQILATLDAATKLKDQATLLWEAMTEITEAARTLSSHCHKLQVETAVRSEGATRHHSEDAKISQQGALMSLADMLQESQTKAGRLKKLDKAQAIEEELDQASPRSPPVFPRKEQQEEEGTPAATTPNFALPKAPGCVPNEEHTSSK